MEIEAKFSFRTAAGFADWRKRTSLGPFTLGQERSTSVVDEYLDTAARDCMRGGYACRVRRQDEKAIATLKSLADATSGADASVRRRAEYEITLQPSAVARAPADEVSDWWQPETWPESEARALALRLVNGRSLQHLVTIRQRRHERDVLDRGRMVAVLSLDDVSCDDGRPPMYELEVELSPWGDEADLTAIVAALTGDPSFEPAHRSKLQRALEGGQRSSPAPPKAAAGNDKKAEAVRHTVELALYLFDATSSCHRLPVERRRLIETLCRELAAGPRARPNDSAAAARDAALAELTPGAANRELLLQAAVLDLLALLQANRRRRKHSRRLGQKQLHEQPALRELMRDEINQARSLALLLHLAETLASMADQTAEDITVSVSERRTTIAVSGPRAGAAVDVAAAAADLWEGVFGSTLWIVAGAQGDKERPLGLRYDQPLAAAGRLILRRQLNQLHGCEQRVRDGDEEALHDARVAVRRMRTALKLLQRAYVRREVRPLLAGLKATGDFLGNVRDLDVQLESLRSDREHTAGSAAPPAELVAALERRRDQARRRLLQRLASEEYRKWHRRLEWFLERGASGPKGDRRVCDELPQLVWQRYAVVRAYQPRVSNAGLRELHELRKDAKQFRYLLEFFRELLGKRTPDLIAQITAAQDALGQLHDASVLRDLLAEQYGDGNVPSDVTAYRDHTLAAITEHRRGFRDLWPILVSRRFRRRLAKAVATT